MYTIAEAAPAVVLPEAVWGGSGLQAQISRDINTRAVRQNMDSSF